MAVGTALTGGPPHRSQRAGLPHWAPALGVWRQSVPPGRGASRGWVPARAVGIAALLAAVNPKVMFVCAAAGLTIGTAGLR
jgi:hypothetical protein